jgi:antagonist of KipI
MIEILDAGPQTTVQDHGRRGHLRYGIPPSGAMDDYAYVLANRLVGNDDRAAALECTLGGPRFVVHAPCVLAVTGADMPLTINGKRASGWTTHRLAAGDDVKLGFARAGVRTYVAFSGGIDVPLVMGSRSTYLRGKLGGYQGRALLRGDRISVDDHELAAVAARRVAAHALPTYGGAQTLRVVLGPQADRFTRAGLETFLSSSYEMLPQSDRMGARLRGARIEHAHGPDIISDGIAAGSVQVPGDGQPIVLLVDRQSTGGYTKLATVCSVDIARLAQARPGETLRFSGISVAAAHELLRAARARLDSAIE